VARRWLKIGVGAGASVATLLGFFALLTTLYGIQITDLSGNFSCEGTFDNPCVSYFTTKTPSGVYVDIYSQDQVKLDFSPGVVDYALFIKDGRCSATGACRCELSDGSLIGLDGWRCVDFTNKTKPREDKVYNFRFTGTQEWALVGLKPTEWTPIKWGFGVEDKGYLDPVWDGTVKRGDKREVSERARARVNATYEEVVVGFEIVFKNEEFVVEVCTNTTTRDGLVFDCRNETRTRRVVDEGVNGPPLYRREKQTALIVNDVRYDFDTKQGWACPNSYVLVSKNDGGLFLKGRKLCDANGDPILDSGESYEIYDYNNRVVERRSDIGTI